MGTQRRGADNLATHCEVALAPRVLAPRAPRLLRAGPPPRMADEGREPFDLEDVLDKPPRRVGRAPRMADEDKNEDKGEDKGEDPKPFDLNGLLDQPVSTRLLRDGT